ncbi:MAG: sigma-70 family RNA polymerase sigma factor [Tepidisphaeraceae bacterium]
MTVDPVPELSRAMARGDRAAFDRFYRAYFDWMYRVAAACTKRDESFCLDVVQDAVVRVVKSIQPMQSEAHLKNWLRLVVRTCALDRLRSEQRRIARNRAIRRADLMPSESLDHVELLAHVLSKLDPQLVRLIELRYAQGFTLARLATMFGSTTGAIDGRLKRAITRLREDWSDGHDD